MLVKFSSHFLTELIFSYIALIEEHVISELTRCLNLAHRHHIDILGGIKGCYLEHDFRVHKTYLHLKLMASFC